MKLLNFQIDFEDGGQRRRLTFCAWAGDRSGREPLACGVYVPDEKETPLPKGSKYRSYRKWVNDHTASPAEVEAAMGLLREALVRMKCLPGDGGE